MLDWIKRPCLLLTCLWIAGLISPDFAAGQSPDIFAARELSASSGAPIFAIIGSDT
jgi:hypothetical protein